jgi:mono/diheme cytochrome c family protein
MRTNLSRTLFFTAAAAVALCAASSGQMTKTQEKQEMGMESHIGKLTGHATAGEPHYRRFCVGCHGELGDGEGDNAMWIDPKPRNFTLGIFKCRSTPTGTLPTDEDLFNTIGRGLINSNMPQWRPLTDQDRADLVAYVKHFSPRFASEKPGSPIQIPPKPEITAERIKAGQEVFRRVECWKCHGVEGRGNGPSADTLKDDQDRPIKAFNFHDTDRFKCGTTDEDLYKIFMTGLDGTPMPSFMDNLKPEDAWNLTFYMRTLQPMHSKAKDIARQLGLKPIRPSQPVAKPETPNQPPAQPETK